jgi:Uma2 family endonuclease
MTVVGFPPISDADLMRLGDLNPGWSFERNDEGSISMSPSSWKSGSASVQAVFQLKTWADAGPGGLVLESSTGFRMPTNAVRCPDGAWVKQSRVDSAEITDPDSFFPGPPDVAIEIGSPSDEWEVLVAKIEMYIHHGTQFAIAIECRGDRVFALGTPPDGLELDIEKIKRAGL